MDIFLIVVGIILLIIGFVGAVIPALPGPPLSYVALLLLHFTSKHQFSAKFLIIWAVVVAIVVALDYLVPIWGTKKFGGSKAGIWGCAIGAIIGIFMFPPYGIIVGPFIGAVVGELIIGKDSSSALKAGVGSFIGFLVGTLLKIVVSVMMAWYFFKELI